MFRKLKSSARAWHERAHQVQPRSQSPAGIPIETRWETGDGICKFHNRTFFDAAHGDPHTTIA
jgi:hypothetical protein